VAAAVYGHLGGLVRKNVVMLLSGGNVDVTLISRIIERGLVKDGRMAHLNVRVKDRPGALAQLTASLAESGANIVSLEHRRGHGEVWVTEAEVALTLETRGPDHVAEIARKLGEAGYVVERDWPRPSGIFGIAPALPGE
jgi:threonine dehydratase